MKIRNWMGLAILGASSLVFAGSALSQDAGEEKEPPKFKSADPRDHDQAEMMANWMATTQPNRFHKRLGRYVGDFDYVMKMWMAPGAAPMETKGEATTSWLFADKWTKMETEYNMMGMNIKGFGVTGYNSFKKKYVGTWCDSFGTQMLYMEGNYIGDDKTLIMYGLMDEPMTGEHDKMVKYVIREEDDDNYTFEIHDMPIGEEGTKVIEINYTRTKGE